MVRTVRDRLLDALDDLTEDELRRFKGKLREFPVQEGYSNIPRGRLERADAVDLADLLLQYYTEAEAPQVAAGVLKAVSCQRQAEQLLLGASRNDACSEAPQPSISVCAGTCGTQAAAPPELHFIDRHRDALIQRTATVEGILDMLHGSSLMRSNTKPSLQKEPTRRRCGSSTNWCRAGTATARISCTRR
ncbi:hypothetical protein JRQ81_006065 [Phrynocephalus forsythii]|uniref:Pyrin domain-containing protein n=1 Tax=Phrynocephalus forsythii TaxID=171643 RepID=A0A9Q1AW40_9SAUR|nr:hypothetical protein JRQ81_006065 [Phrynocephalus forsythii]